MCFKPVCETGTELLVADIPLEFDKNTWTFYFVVGLTYLSPKNVKKKDEKTMPKHPENVWKYAGNSKKNTTEFQANAWKVPFL